jgi:TRAP-type mannitol/chloroaromatic compound transport system permease small subunit
MTGRRGGHRCDLSAFLHPAAVGRDAGGRGGIVNILLALSRLIDGLNGAIGRIVYWAVLVAVIISSGNAVVRYGFNTSSNAWLEVQWYLFSAIFMLCAGYTLLRNEHIRIDVIVSRFSERTLTWIDIIGTTLFLLPISFIIMYLSWPVLVDSFVRHEMSSDAGGLIRWPVKLLIPAGFLLLVLQGISELIKRIAFLQGLIPNPAPKKQDAHSPVDGAAE